jgi:hypothetical protein
MRYIFVEGIQGTFAYHQIKNFLHLDYPCGKTTGYYAKVMLLRSTGNFLYTLVTLWQATGNSQVKTV